MPRLRSASTKPSAKPASPKLSGAALKADLEAKIEAIGGIDEIARLDRTLLLDAVVTGETKVALALLRLGANPNIPDEAGRSPLLYAAGTSYREPSSGDIDKCPSRRLVRELLKAGADPDANATDPKRYSPLQACLSERLRWSVLTLVKAGASLGHLTPEERQKAEIASGVPFERLEELQGARSAKMERSVKAAAPLIRRALKKGSELAQRLAREAAAKSAAQAAATVSQTPEKSASSPPPKQAPAARKILRPDGALTLSRPIRGEPPLTLNEKIALVGVNGRAHTGDSLLIYAIVTHEIKEAMELLRLGANPNLTDTSGRSPLLYAVGASYQGPYGKLAEPNPASDQLSADQRLILALLKAGADPNLTPPDLPRINPLEGALFYKNIWGCLALLQGGARLDQLDEKGKTLLARLSGEDLSAIENSYLSDSINRLDPGASRSPARVRL